MTTLLTDLDAFYLDHRRCGELAAGVEGPMAWIECECGARIVRLVGAELIVRGVHALVSAVRLSETFLGMAVIGMGESVEETARMVAPARRGHPELAWGNVVGTVVILLALNLGLVALIHPLTADPLVVRLHAPYLAGCVLIVAVALLWARRLGRRIGAFLLALFAVYLASNLAHMWQ